MIYGDDPVKWNERPENDPLGLTAYTYLPSITAIRQSENLYGYCLNSPISFVDASGDVVTPANVIGALVGLGIGGLLGSAIANHFGLTGWQRNLAISGGAALIGVAGWFAGPAILGVISRVTLSAIANSKIALTSLSAGVIKTLNLGQQAVQNAINNVNTFRVAGKHLLNAGGSYAKFASDSREVINQWIVQALSLANNLEVNSEDSFYAVVYMGKAVGSKGEQYIRVIFSVTGKIITAFPVSSGG